MAGKEIETRVHVDIDRVMSDEALKGLPDGPAKRFLFALGRELDYDEGDVLPQLIVRRGPASAPRGPS